MCLSRLQEESVFRWLQSVDARGLAFVAVDPVRWFPDYVVNLLAEDAATLDIRRPEEAGICVAATLPGRPEEMPVNLLGPIIVNVRNGRAEQIVVEDPRCHTRRRFLAEAPMTCPNAA